MKKYKALIEWIKTAAIALLLALAVFFGAQTGLFNDFFKSIPIFGALAGALRDTQTTPPPGPGIISNEAARPCVIVITDEWGSRYSIRYDVTTLGRDYEQTSTVFGEAISSALPAEEITEGEWRSALQEPGVYYEYRSPVRLGVLAGWLGVTCPAEVMGDYAVRRAFVTFDGERNTLYLENSGTFYECKTASPGGTPSGFSAYTGNGALFAFETGHDFSFAPYTLISPETEHPVLSSDTLLTAREMIDATLAALGITGQLESSYMKRGDSLVFIGQSFTLTATQDGRVKLSGTASMPDADLSDESHLIELARVIVAGTIGMHSGVAEPHFDTVTMVGQAQSVTFRYHAAGGLIRLSDDGCAAMITLSGSAITEMELFFRTFADTGEIERLMPELQTLAAAGTEFTLCYTDAGGGLLRPVWAKISEEALP